jgi:hypothetical protein
MPIAGSEVRQFTIAKSVNVNMCTNFTYQFGFLTASGHLDLNFVNTQISFKTEALAQPGKDGENVTKLNLYEPLIKFDKDASTINIEG